VSETFRFPPIALPPEAEALRGEVRDFLAEEGAAWTLLDRAHSWTHFNRGFSRAVGARGWIGMTWPKEYGGHERSAFERYVVLEEMLVAGAPVGAHWFGDRQSGPLLLKAGTEAQRRALLPRIASGELTFCIGLSEPDSGSDLASLRTRATPLDDGRWQIDGTKVWTTNAQHCDYMIALVRTSPAGEGAPRQSGLSQFLVDLTLSGISIKPIPDLTGEAHFNEVHFDGVVIGADAMIGGEGRGWAQANAELAYERSGPDRYLSAFPVVQPALDRLEANGGHDVAIGRLVARYASLRGMSLSVAGMLQQGVTPLQEAALVKDLGVDLEQETPALLGDLLDVGPDLHGDGGLDDALAFLTQVAPTFSLRGGTREIMRGMTARGLGLR
jgi:alkylation response protein AidB-like acyl-CoA dehydrogenase